VFYNQTTTGGITGGAVSGYTGNDYFATANYNGATIDISNPGVTVQMSASFFYNGQLTPLAPGANGIRSFRLGLIASGNSAFETSFVPSVWVGGDIGLAANSPPALGLTAWNMTKSFSTSIGGFGAPVVVGDWYRVDATFTNAGANQIVSMSIFDLGQNGLGNPILVNTGSFTAPNFTMPDLTSASAGFSDLTGGGFSQLDNFEVDGPLSTVAAPSPVVGAGLPGLMLLAGGGVLGWWRRKRKAEAAA
jgi:hypothetical protein